MTIRFVAVFADPAKQTSLLSVGETADIAVARARRDFGVNEADLKAMPVTRRLREALEMGRTVRSCREVDGVIDVGSFR